MYHYMECQQYSLLMNAMIETITKCLPEHFYVVLLFCKNCNIFLLELENLTIQYSSMKVGLKLIPFNHAHRTQ